MSASISQVFREGNLQFEFSPSWVVVKLDDHPHYRRHVQRSTGSKAVDFAAAKDGTDLRALLLIEVKDYRGRSKKRLTSGDLAKNVITKVRDSLAIIVGAYHMSGDTLTWKRIAHALLTGDAKPRVVLWLEEESSTNRASQLRLKQKRDTFQKKLKQLFRWLTTDARLVELSNYTDSIPNVTVTSLP